MLLPRSYPQYLDLLEHADSVRGQLRGDNSGSLEEEAGKRFWESNSLRKMLESDAGSQTLSTG